MASSTPINQIRNMRNQTQGSSSTLSPGDLAAPQQTDDQLMNDILKEMGSGPGEDNLSDMNVNSFQYAMDESQVPPEKVASSKFDDVSQAMNDEISGQLGETSFQEKLNSNKKSQLSGITDLNLSLNSNNLKTRIINFIKIPFVVFVLVFLFGLPQVNKLIFRVFPYLLHESGQISVLGNLLKSLIITALVMLIQYFV